MKVLMISSDSTFLGKDYSGDVIERHREYAKRVELLDIMVLSKKGIRLKFGKYDLIVCQDPFYTGLIGYIYKRILKVPLLIHFHGDFWENKYLQLSKCKLKLSKFLVKKADGIRVVSTGIKNKLVVAGIDSDKIRVISTPVNIDKFLKFDINEVNSLRQKKHIVINVGRDDLSKDYPTLNKAISLIQQKYDNFDFWQIGAEKKVDHQQLINYYHAADVYVSSSKHESFGKVLIEAMACGLPIVATDTTGSKEIVIDGINGFLVPIGNIQVIAEKIEFLFKNPDKAKQMGQMGQKMVKEKFNREIIIQKIIEFWKDLCVE